VAAQLAREDGVVFAHLALDEGVADAAHHGPAAGLLDDLLHGPAAAQVVEDRRAGVAPQDVLGDQRRHDVHRHDLAAFVDEARAVGVAVEGHAEVVAALADLGAQRVEGVRLERIRLVVGEAAVGIAVEAGDLQRQALERGGFPDAHGVGEVRRDAQRTADGGALAHERGVLGRDVVARHCAAHGGRRGERARGDDALDVGDAGGAADGHGLRAGQFEAVVRAGVVRGGDHHARVAPQDAVAVVRHRRRAFAQIHHVGALQRDAVGQGREERRGMRADVAPHRHLAAAEERRQRAPDGPRQVLRQLLAIDSPDVVCLENSCHLPPLNAKI